VGPFLVNDVNENENLKESLYIITSGYQRGLKGVPVFDMVGLKENRMRQSKKYCRFFSLVDF
jgi:hypothetical protein